MINSELITCQNCGKVLAQKCVEIPDEIEINYKDIIGFERSREGEFIQYGDSIKGNFINKDFPIISLKCRCGCIVQFKEYP